MGGRCRVVNAGRSSSISRGVARVLWVDDNVDIHGYVTRLLSRHYTVEMAADAASALAAANTHTPDLVISNIELPGTDGFGLLHALRSRQQTSDVPVILLSARRSDKVRVEAARAGADDCMVKPFAARELLARVQAHLTLTQLRREARQQLEAERARMYEVFTQAPVAICLLNGPDHVFTLTNPRYVELLGGRDVVGRPFRQALPELEGQGIFELLDQVYRTGETFVGNEVLIRSARFGDTVPEDRYFTFMYAAFRGPDHVPQGIFVHVYEVTDQVLARRHLWVLAIQREQALLDARHAAEQLAVQSEEWARLDERDRIGMDLHDGAIQRLYGLVLALGARQLAGGASAEDIAEAIARINAVIREIRNCVLDLRLRNLESHGLRAGIEALAEEMRTNTPVRPRIEFVGDDASLSPTITTHVLQLVREAASNVIRHAQATRVTIRLANADGRLVVNVRDNGCGFDQHSSAWRSGNGLDNIIERARRLGGHASVISRPGKGTKVRVWVPLAKA